MTTEIFRPFNGPISTEDLHGVDSPVTQLAKNSPTVCDNPSFLTLFTPPPLVIPHPRTLFKIQCNTFFPSKCGLPGVFFPPSFFAENSVRISKLQLATFPKDLLHSTTFSLRRNKYVGRLVRILSQINPVHIPTQQDLSRYILLWDFHACKIFHLANLFKV